MAFHETLPDMVVQKNSKILVNVEEVLPDIIVVTYTYQSKLFQGVLLDSSKRNLPYGVATLNPAFTAEVKTPSESDDKLYSASQRFAYQEKPAPLSTRRPIKSQNGRVRNARMTVRLRPRQVLCSKCRGICNENSENVDHSRKRKSVENSNGTIVHHDINTRLQAKEKRLNEVSLNSPPRPLFSDNQSNNQRTAQQNNSSLADQLTCPRISRLPSNELKNAINKNKIKIIGNYVVKPSPPSPSENEDPLAIANDPLAFNNNEIPDEVRSENGNDRFYENSDRFVTEPILHSREVPSMSKLQKRMVLRKKKSVGSMEDLWDESVFEESNINSETGHANTRTLKISFGREGEGTVLKIPAKIDSFNPNENDGSSKDSNSSAKAARRALKRAKKEARRKILISSSQSPCYTLGAGSPRYTLTSPRYVLGGTSPRYTISNTDSLIPRRHKHKVKHKKKHKEDRKHTKINNSNEDDPLFIPETYTAIKERCLKQKLSISLKRLNENSYSAKCDAEDKSSPGSSDGGSEENAPDFPPAPQPLMMHISACPMVTGLDADGNRLEVGNVVWGKIHGFPWWPGKVLSITASDEESPETRRPQAHVAWYGSSTSSLMPCDQLSPFLENFKIRYNKKKRGPYKEAIRQATSEARNDQIQSANTAVSPVMVPLVSPPLASPREIDVVS